MLARSPEPLVPEPDEGDHEPDRDHPQPDVEDDVGGGGGAVDAVLAVQLVDLDKRGETWFLAHDKPKKCFLGGKSLVHSGQKEEEMRNQKPFLFHPRGNFLPPRTLQSFWGNRDNCINLECRINLTFNRPPRRIIVIAFI